MAKTDLKTETLPEVHAAVAATKTVEAWSQDKATPAWLFGAAKAVGGWGEGRVLTEAEYEATCAKASGARMLGGDLIERPK